MTSWAIAERMMLPMNALVTPMRSAVKPTTVLPIAEEKFITAVGATDIWAEELGILSFVYVVMNCRIACKDQRTCAILVAIPNTYHNRRKVPAERTMERYQHLKVIVSLQQSRTRELTSL